MSAMKLVSAVTLPVLSLTSGRLFNKRIEEVLADTLDISDLWLNYYCTATNLTKNGIAQPISQSRFLGPVRASMSVAGFVPPYYMNSDMLIDGCYSNIPISNSRSLGASTIFAIDVSDELDFPSRNYGEIPHQLGNPCKSVKYR